GLKVNEKVIATTLQQELPFLATENILMEAVKHGGDRQAIHELIRRCSMEARARMNEGLSCDLLERLLASGELPLREEELRSLCDPSAFTGRCAEQVESYLARLRPLLQGVNAHADDTEV
ncbi:MAG: adenylosuccinate lyase, partial [Clostridiales bacterium]|nr:adenylosuccinate lyase [Candidatus Apopatocola equi]